MESKLRQLQKADYGVYGSLRLYFTFFGVVVILVLVALYSEQLRTLALALLGIALLAAFSLLVIIREVFQRGRARPVDLVIQRGGVKAGDRVLDVGTGPGFLAVEIAKKIKAIHVRLVKQLKTV